MCSLCLYLLNYDFNSRFIVKFSFKCAIIELPKENVFIHSRMQWSGAVDLWFMPSFKFFGFMRKEYDKSWHLEMVRL